VTTSSVTLSAGALLSAPATLLVSGDWTNSGGLFDANDRTVVFNGPRPQRLLNGGQPFANLTHTGAGVLTLADDLTLSGTFTNGPAANGAASKGGGPVRMSALPFGGSTLPVSSGPAAGNVDATNRTLRVVGNWSWNGGQFLSTGSTVIFTGTHQFISGNTTFGNLTKMVSAADTLTFAAGSTQTITGTLTLRGAFGQPLSLRSSVPNQKWFINPRLTVLAFLDVKDSQNLNGALLAPANSSNSGGNTGWIFA
jgi:hypothetical protein